MQLPILRRMGATTATQRQRATRIAELPRRRVPLPRADPRRRDVRGRGPGQHARDDGARVRPRPTPGHRAARDAAAPARARRPGRHVVRPRDERRRARRAALPARPRLRQAGPRRRSSPGPSGCTRCPGRIAEIPHLDAVVISHDHYDHLDEPSIRQLERTHRPHYVVPLGVDAAPARVGRADRAHHEPRLARGDRDRGHPHHVHRGPALLRAAASCATRRSGRRGRCTGRATRSSSAATRGRRTATPTSAPTSAPST